MGEQQHSNKVQILIQLHKHLINLRCVLKRIGLLSSFEFLGLGGVFLGVKKELWEQEKYMVA